MKQFHKTAIATLVSLYAASTFAQEELSFLEEVVVTAQYIEQSAQEIPIAMTAISGETLEARGQTSTAMIGAQAPNVQLQPGPASQGNSLNAFIRGVGQADNSPALEPGVGIYIDDVYYSNVQGAVLELLDLERVEISRGPQGTLAGKNAIGGAIKMYSKRPDEERNAFFEVSAGNFDARKLRGATNITLADGLYARVSGLYNKREGHVDNLDFGCAFPGLGVPSGTSSSDCVLSSLGGIENQAARLALSWEASDTLTVDFTADFLDQENEPGANILTAVGPTLAPIFNAPPSEENPLPLAWPWVNPGSPDLPPTSVVPVFEPALNPCIFITSPDAAGACPELQQALGGVYNDGYTAFNTFSDPASGTILKQENVYENTSYAMNVDWDIADNMRVESISAYRNYELSYVDDADASPFSLTTQLNTQEHDAVSQEFRLSTIVNDSVSFVVGAFYQETETDIGGDIILPNSALHFVIDDTVETESFALFANTIWSISDRLEFSGGLRYSDDEKTFEFDRLNPDGVTAPIACDIVEVAPGVSIINPTSSPNCLVGGINDTPPQVFSDDRIDYRAALSFFASEDATLFFSVASGYKAGGANARPFFAEQLLTHDSEEVTALEIGGKFDLLNNSLRLNASVFKNDYDDVIVTLFNCTGVVDNPLFGSPCFLPTNLGKADVQGFELELDWAPIENLLIDGSFGYIDFEYTEVGGGLTTETQQPFTPEVTWSLGTQYDINSGIGRITPRLDVYYQDDIFSQPSNSPSTLVESRTLANASLTWASADELWSVTARVDNLTDEYYTDVAVDFTTGGNGYANAAPALPRTYSLAIRRNFD